MRLFDPAGSAPPRPGARNLSLLTLLTTSAPCCFPLRSGLTRREYLLGLVSLGGAGILAWGAKGSKDVKLPITVGPQQTPQVRGSQPGLAPHVTRLICACDEELTVSRSTRGAAARQSFRAARVRSHARTFARSLCKQQSPTMRCVRACRLAPAAACERLARTRRSTVPAAAAAAAAWSMPRRPFDAAAAAAADAAGMA